MPDEDLMSLVKQNLHDILKDGYKQLSPKTGQVETVSPPAGIINAALRLLKERGDMADERRKRTPNADDPLTRAARESAQEIAEAARSAGGAMPTDDTEDER